VFAAFVFDVCKQQACVVVAIAQLAAVRVDSTADQMKVVGVFIASDAPQLVAFCGDAAVRVVGERTGSAAGQGDLCQTVSSIPLVVRRKGTNLFSKKRAGFS